MKHYFLFFCILFLSCTAKAQWPSIAGHWEGVLPQSNKAYDFQLSMDIEQKGDSLTGTSTLVNPKGGAYVTLLFKGAITKTGKVTLKEYRVVKSTPIRKLDWCIKRFTGQFSSKKQKLILSGTWRSTQLYANGKYYTGHCSPGRFTMEKRKEPPTKTKIKIQTSPLVTVKGYIYDQSTLLSLEASLFFSKADLSPNKVEANKTKGYTQRLEANTDYTITIKKEGYLPIKSILRVRSEDLVHNLFLRPIETTPDIEEAFSLNTSIILENVLFQQSTAQILPESMKELERLYRHLRLHTDYHITIEGHTDRIGSYKKNMILSEERSKAIKTYLIKKGIRGKRIDTIGYGPQQIICRPPCKKNRRVAFVLSKKKQK